MEALTGRDSQAIKFTCHAGRLSGAELPNSIDGIEACLRAGAFRVEIDVHSMADGAYVVCHASRLEDATTSRGAIGRLTSDEAKRLRRIDAPELRLPLLDEVVDLVAPYDCGLQLDLKDWRPLTSDRVEGLVRAVARLGKRAIVSSGQDWNLRAIAGKAPELRLGFDPDHYLAAGGRQAPMPARLGAYGYRDDHPLAYGRAQSTEGYFLERLDMLLAQCPFAREFFLERRLVWQAAAENVFLPMLLHERGVKSTAWTLDYDGADSMRQLERLAAAGIDHVTTNTGQQFLSALNRKPPGS